MIRALRSLDLLNFINEEYDHLLDKNAFTKNAKELSEINDVISRFNHINKVYTTIIEKDRNKSIATYFTAREQINKKELITFLKEKLPIYMIPGSLIQMDEFPLNVNGKIDKNKLPQEANEQQESKNIIKAKNQKEKILLNILFTTPNTCISFIY